MRRIRWQTAALAGAIGTIALLGSATAQAGPGDRKTDRQIEIFETVLDEMLVDSPNWLVQGHRNARGRYKSGEGVRFIFDAGLVNGEFGNSWWGGFSKGKLRFGRDHDWGDWDDWDRDDDETRDERRERRQEWRDRELTRQERIYKRGKTEVVDVLMDFGDVLTTVPDNEWIEISIDLERAEYFWEKDLRELNVRVKMADVRAYADEKIDEKKFVERIEIKES
jgi:hypothetical protein